MPGPVIAVCGNATRDINRGTAPRWVHRRPGGSLLYASCALAALGARVRAVGHAPPGAYVLLRRAGVETHAVWPTFPGTRFLNRYGGGSRTQLALPGQRLSTRMLIRIGDADGVLVAPVLGEVLASRLPHVPFHSLVDIQGYVRVLEPPTPLGRWRAVGGIGSMRRLEVPATGVVRGSVEDVAALGMPDPEEAARRLEAMAAPGGVGVVTLGADGALASHDGEIVRVPALSVPVADPTGAGDVFEAGFLYARVEGRDLRESLAWGCATAGSFLSSPAPYFLRRFPDPAVVERAATGLMA